MQQHSNKLTPFCMLSNHMYGNRIRSILALSLSFLTID